MKTRGIHEWFTGLGLCLGALLTLCAIGEVAARLGGAYISIHSMIQDDPFMGKRLKSNAQFRFASPYGEYDATIRTNSRGLRGPEVAMPKPPHTYRIALLGDSMIWGWGVAEDQTPAAVLQRTLQEREPQGERAVDVVNAAMQGNSTSIEYMVLREYVLPLSPDLIVLTFYINDVHDNLRFEPAITWDEHHLPQRFRTAIDTSLVRSFLPVAVRRLLKERSYLYNFLHQRYAILHNRFFERTLKETDIGNIMVDQAAVLRDVDTPAIRRGWRKTKALVSAVAELARSTGAEFLLLLAPAGCQVDGEEWAVGRQMYQFSVGCRCSDAPQRVLTEFGAESGIPVLDLLPDLQAHSGPPLYFDYDGHWTEEGCRVVGETLAAYVEAHHLRN